MLMVGLVALTHRGDTISILPAVIASVAAAILLLAVRNLAGLRFDEFWIYPISCLVFLLTHTLVRLRRAGGGRV
jgi:hypothetical protein